MPQTTPSVRQLCRLRLTADGETGGRDRSYKLCMLKDFLIIDKEEFLSAKIHYGVFHAVQFMYLLLDKAGAGGTTQAA